MKNKTIVVQSPGRINLIGEHTDYNDGYVLPAAVDKKSVFHLTQNGSANRVNIIAQNMNETFSFDLSDFQPIKNGWENYVMGVVRELQNLGAKIQGFDGKFGGDVPIGGGMSSSAALECSLAYGLNELFALGLDKWQLIKASQLAEHNFVGIKCGIMDQFASMMGQKNRVMLLDCRSLEFQYFPFDLENYQLLLLNTNVSHSLASSAYNTRREECETGVSILQKKHPEVKSLRDVSFDMLHASIADLSKTVFKRCKHVVLENNRVLEATKALNNNDFPKLGELIYQSHFSLQSCPELDFLVQQTLDKEYVLGSRMMGGGFGGCTINLIKTSEVAGFKSKVALNYQKEFGKELTPYEVSIEDGAGLVEG
jgi:galactokinase